MEIPWGTSYHTLPDGRRLAFTGAGPQDADDLLLCLPGVLEIRKTFDPVLGALPAGLRCISVDHCGRGDSDPLPGDLGYSMARYLDDLTHFLSHHLSAHARLHLLGTSMGGLLTFYLANNKALPVRSILLNDIGLSLDWMALVGMSKDMKSAGASLDARGLAASLQVTNGVLSAVQSPTHFDLPYRRSLRGMRFEQLIDGFPGTLRLAKGQLSQICTAVQIQELQRLHPTAQVLEVQDAGHPVLFDEQVCSFLLEDLCSVREGAPARQQAMPPGASAQLEPPKGLWSWVKRQFRAQ